ncbi:lamin tail domain-containing protein [Amycolatopsis sp. 195334CR]|uniref:lamin tail domain-containing protein n=1 Tax=Amycolatopsis sp. 195334CR TaxID=2814588 RepID=UPI001A8D6A0C|nr:lamin tail domain-containing protein [Amycolatopsis sp. 195334CR]MBN6042079.1 lamin tail domain-containing protein [Amycolatopsis sp. 195334CR]
MPSRLCHLAVVAVLTAAAPGPAVPPVRIHQLLAGPAGFLELRNLSAAPVWLDGWSVLSCHGSALAELARFPAGSAVPGGGSFVLAGLDFAGEHDADLLVPAVPGTGQLLLDGHQARVDGVAVAPESPCRENEAAAPCPGPLSRDALSTDTDNNRVDFGCPSPPAAQPHP